MLSRFMIIIAITACTLCTHAVQADGTIAEGPIKERIQSMKGFGKAMKEMVGMMRGKVPFDAARVATLARSVAERSGANLTKHFPKGSMNEKSEALPTIWQDWSRFEQLAEQMEFDALTLADVAEDGQEFPREAFKAFAGNCRGCHKPFRMKKN